MSGVTVADSVTAFAQAVLLSFEPNLNGMIASLNYFISLQRLWA